MGQDTHHIFKILDRLNSNIDEQRNRSSLMQRWLDDDEERLTNLAIQIDARIARLNALRSKNSSG